MSKHTPGPWTLIWNEQNARQKIGVWLIHNNGTHIADSRRCAQDRPGPLADARLIAAAPDLLAALKFMADKTSDPALVAVADAAIAKAEGV